MERDIITVEVDQVVDVDRLNGIARLDDGHEVPVCYLRVLGGTIAGEVVVETKQPSTEV